MFIFSFKVFFNLNIVSIIFLNVQCRRALRGIPSEERKARLLLIYKIANKKIAYRCVGHGAQLFDPTMSI